MRNDEHDEKYTLCCRVPCSDLTNPQRVDQLGFGQNSYSAVDWDPKAFLYWGERDLAVIPVSAWNYNEETGEEGNSSTAVLVRINDDGSLTELGRIGHPVTSDCESYYQPEPFEGEAPPAIDDADAEASFAEADAVAPETEPIYEDYCWSYQPDIQRSIIIGDAIYTVSDGGLQMNDLDSLETISWTAFNQR